MNLEQEAEEYANEFIESGYAYNGFIEGANSKFVKQQILQAQIDVLKKAMMLMTKEDGKKANLRIIIELEKELET